MWIFSVFFASFEYLVFFLPYFMFFTVPCSIWTVTFSNMSICSYAFLLIMIYSYSILSYATYSLYANSVSTHSFFSLFHSVCISFLVCFYWCTIFAINSIGIWSLKISWSFIVWWFYISTFNVDNVQSIRLNDSSPLFLLMHVNSSLLLLMTSPYVLIKFSIYLPPMSVYPVWHQLFICEL